MRGLPPVVRAARRLDEVANWARRWPGGTPPVKPRMRQTSWPVSPLPLGAHAALDEEGQAVAAAVWSSGALLWLDLAE